MPAGGPVGFTRRPAKESPFQAACYVDHVNFTVGAETGGNTINVAMQFKDANNNNLPGTDIGGGRGGVLAFLSDNNDGSTISSSLPTSTLVGTNGLNIPLVANSVFLLVSDATGAIDLNIVKNAAHAYYLVVVLPDGSFSISPIINLT